MQKKQTKQAELLNSQSSMNQADNSISNLNTELVKREQYKDTPIWLISYNDNGFTWLTIGKYKLSTMYANFEIAKKSLENPSIELIIEITGVMIELFNEYNKEEK